MALKVLDVTEKPDDYSLEHRPGKYIAADDKTLQIDLDSAEVVESFKRAYEKLRHDLEFYSDDLVMGESALIGSKTLGHFHATIPLNIALVIEQRLIIQLLLGSDVTRERLAWMRWRQGIADPIVLATK